LLLGTAARGVLQAFSTDRPGPRGGYDTLSFCFLVRVQFDSRLAMCKHKIVLLPACCA
jgi:hypothetical protein